MKFETECDKTILILLPTIAIDSERVALIVAWLHWSLTVRAA